MTESKPYILIIEDEPEISDMIAARLRREGIRTIQCQKENEAIAKIKNQDFACAIVDLFLKQGSGQKLIEYLDEQSKAKNTLLPIFVISGHLDVRVIKGIRGRISGAFVKPFDMNTLIEKIKSTISF